MTYESEQRAQRRVASLRAHGIWPGMRRNPDGTFSLTHDPDLSGKRHLPPIGDQGANGICPPSDQAQQGGKSDLPPDATEGTGL